jgi:chromosome segregation ATPase
MSKNVHKASLANLKHYEGKWRSGATRTIRVPITLADATLEYARNLDTEMSPDTGDLSIELKWLKDEIEWPKLEIGLLKKEKEALQQELETVQQALSEVQTENQKWRNAFAIGDQTVAQAEESANFENKVWEREFTEMETERDSLAQALTETKQQYSTLLGTLHQELQELRSQLEAKQAKLSATPSPKIEPLEAADLLNRLKAKRKKVTASLADVETILEILEG